MTYDRGQDTDRESRARQAHNRPVVKSVTITADLTSSEAAENSRYYAALQKSQGSMSQRGRSRSTSRGPKRTSIIVASNSGVIENPPALERHSRLVNALSVNVKRFNATNTQFRIYHGSTNTTRSDVQRDPERSLDISELSNVLFVDQHRRVASCEPNVAFDQLLSATLPLGLTPPVVPEFPGITVGGAFAGSAGESSSFKYGFVDSIVESVQCILGNGEIREVNKGDALFNALAGSLGTIGIVTRVDIQLVEAKIFVETQYHRVNSFSEASEKITEAMKPSSGNDFVDGIMYSADKGAVITGRMTDHTNGGKVVTFHNRFDDWFYLHAEKMIEKPHEPIKRRSQAKRHFDRWSSSEESIRTAVKQLPSIPEGQKQINVKSSSPGRTQNYRRKIQKLRRRIVKVLPFKKKRDSDSRSMSFTSSSSNSTDDAVFQKESGIISSGNHEVTYLAPPKVYIPVVSYLFRYDRGGFWVGRLPFTYFTLPFIYPIRCIMDKYLHTRPMYHALHAAEQQRLYVIEDVAVPITAAPTFLNRLTADLDIFPLWLCPLTFRGADAGGVTAKSLPSPRTAPRSDVLLNVGVWGRVRKDDDYLSANKRLEALVREFNGVKWLYAQMFYTETEFWDIYDRKSYVALREKYYATKALPDVYEKIRLKTEAREPTEEDIDNPQPKKGLVGKLKARLVTVWVFPGLYGLYKAHKGQDYMWKSNA